MTNVKVNYYTGGSTGEFRGSNEFTIKDKKGVSQVMNTEKILKKIKKQM